MREISTFLKCFLELDAEDQEAVMERAEDLHELRSLQKTCLKNEGSEVSDSDDDLRDAWTGRFRGTKREGSVVFPGWA